MKKIEKYFVLPSIVFLLTAACTAANQSKSLYEEDFKLAIENTDSKFLKDVYSDGIVTDAELAESHDLFAACIEEAGMELEFKKDGGVNLNTNFKATDDPVKTAEDRKYMNDNFFRCDEEYGKEIEWLYSAPRDNPQKENENQRILACLIRNGLEEEGFTVEDFFAKYTSSNAPDLSDSPQGEACVLDPKNS